MRCQLADHVLRLTLDRPEKRNALDLATMEGLAAGLSRARDDHAVRVLCLEAEGPTWCAGADLASFVGHPGGRQGAMHGFAEVLADLAECAVPTVAVVDGAVLGGGVGLLCACDLAVASPRSSVGLPESGVGVWPMMVGALLGRVTSERRAMELAVTGAKWNAEEACRAGLLSRVAEAPGADAEVLCASIASKSPSATRIGRAAWRQHAGFSTGLRARLHALADALDEVANHPDAAEGIAAFFQKRPPNWQ
jgi:enoyl-CoA hydratase/carnithine racemase